MDVRREIEHLLPSALGGDPHAALIAARRLAELAGWLEERAVRSARQNGWAWAPIGRLLQVTRQAAFNRYRHLDDIAPRVPRGPRAEGEIAEIEFRGIQRKSRLRDELRAWEASGTDIVPW